jgi:hypothetical protein
MRSGVVKTAEAKSRLILERAVLLFVGLMPFDIIPLVLGRSVTTPIGVLVTLLWVVHNVKFGSRSFLSRKAILGGYAWIVWCTATVWWSPALTVTAVAVGSLLVQLVMVVVLCEVLPDMRERSVLWFSAGATALSIWALAAPLAQDASGRVRVGGVDQNVTGLVLTVGVAGAVYLLVFRAHKVSQLILIVEIGLMFAAVVKVGSRTAVVAVAVVMLAVVAISISRFLRGESVRILRMAAITVVGAGLYVFLVSKSFVPPRILQFLESPTTDTDSGRSDIIASYLRFQEMWVWKGVGYGADSQFLVAQGGGYQNAHSLFWKTWIETGLVGLVLLGLLIGGALAHSLRIDRSDLLGPVMAMPLAVFGLTLGGDRASVFWYVIALCLCVTVRRRASDPMSAQGKQHTCVASLE